MCLQFNNAVAGGIYHGGFAKHRDRLVVHGRAAQVAVPEKMVFRLIYVVYMAKNLKAAVKIIVAVTPAERGGVADENIQPFMFFYAVFKLFCALKHLLIAVLISSETALAAAESRDAQALVFNDLAVNIRAALRRADKIRCVVVSVYVKQRSGDHGDKIAQIGAFKVAAGYYDICSAENGGVKVVPYEFAFKIRNCENFYIIHRLFVGRNKVV